VLIETVGVGQSETTVAALSDVFLLLLAPAGGDELQGVKRGIMEMADIILVNKADGELRPQAVRTCADYAGALRLLRRRPQVPEGYPLAMTVSAVSGEGLEAAWEAITGLAEWRRAEGIQDRIRAEQARHWFHRELEAEMFALLAADPALRGRMAALEAEVAAGRLSPGDAAGRVLAPLTGRLRDAERLDARRESP
jgi:LAO/AO transport system kinase